MFWSRPKPKQPRDMVPEYYNMTQERFEAWVAHLRKLNTLQSEDQKFAADQLISEINARRLLIEAGWLPPRECDVMERTGPEGGTLLAGHPTKWTVERCYTRRELGLWN